MLIIKRISKRLPGRANIISVYSIIAFMIYSWTFLTFFYKLSSWVYHLTTNEIANIFTYAMVVDWFESVLILGGILFLCLLLPAAFLKDDFTIRGTWLVISYIGTLMIYLIPSLNIKRWVESPGLWFIITVFLTTLFTIVLSHISVMRRFALFISDRMTVLLLIFMPLSVISCFIIVIRFLF